MALSTPETVDLQFVKTHWIYRYSDAVGTRCWLLDLLKYVFAVRNPVTLTFDLLT